MRQDAWIECVPNFSEGRRPEVIDAIAQSLRRVDGAWLLDRSLDADHNRSVLTLVAGPDAVVQAAVALVGEALERIDLTQHSGVHPRMGACDVFPLVPLQGLGTSDCNELCREIGAELAERFDLPVYLYGEAAQVPTRRLLERVRIAGTRQPGVLASGAFEHMREAVPREPDLRPDYGPAALHATGGAIAVGTRFFLIAYNVNLETTDRQVAVRIANTVREARGGLPAVKALGMELPAQGCVQVSMNLTDYRRSSLATVFREVASLAAGEGVAVRGSELIGLVPQDALDRSFRGFLQLEPGGMRRTSGQTPLVASWPLEWPDADEGMPAGPTRVELNVMAVEQLADRVSHELDGMQAAGARVLPGRLEVPVGDATIRAAVAQFLKLPALRDGQVLELAANTATGGLFAGTIVPEDPVALLRPFLRELGSDSETPGGGGVAALAAALAAALGQMVAAFTIGKKKYADVQDEVRAITTRLAQKRERAVQMIEDDAVAFERIGTARKLPKGSDAATERRTRSIQSAMVGAAEVPLDCAALAASVLKEMEALARIGNRNLITDAGAGAVMAHAAVETALLNVRVNVKYLKDATTRTRLTARAEGLATEAAARRNTVMAIVDEALA